MVPYSLINFYIDRKFHLPKSALGTIMSVTWIMSSIGNIFASAISKRIGLVMTMAATHLPSAFFLALIPAPNVLWLTAVMLVGRGTLASMDQAPRSAFLSKAFAPDERTAVMGIVNVVKTLSQSGGPTVTGVLAGEGRFWIAFAVAGALKASYDVGLLTLFLKTDRAGRSSAGPPEGAVRLATRDSEDSFGNLADEFELETDDEASVDSDNRTGKRRDSVALAP
ncbi:Major facilitator superfamily [Macrophomina phaseolina MS6]|uniref:Major facilitator superfamily n=2 Tax=Macrophomina phaseolina TaxID=35725 RepID=K2S853_MACPH|nr:Major facilitator superfamily [Macrophomina phaseolina MS6]